MPYWLGVEVEHPVADLGPQIAPLDQIQRPGHYPHVDALLGGPALHVADIALQRHHVPLPRAFRVYVCKDTCMRDEAQSRAVGGPPVVVVDGLADHLGRVLIAETLEYLL